MIQTGWLIAGQYQIKPNKYLYKGKSFSHLNILVNLRNYLAQLSAFLITKAEDQDHLTAGINDRRLSREDFYPFCANF